MGWPGGVILGTLECVPHKVSVSNPPGANFCGLAHPSGGRWDWSGGLVGPSTVYGVYQKKKKLKQNMNRNRKQGEKQNEPRRTQI